ncbi:FAD:protein FMN transferase, partial [Faecalibacillus intestinalis]
MKKILISIIIFSFLLCGCQKTTPLSHKEFCLDTIVQITLYDSSSKNILNNCFNLCKKYELVFSANNKESELYKINHAHHKLDEQPLSKELFKVIKEGLYYSQLSQGAFDITIGSVSSLWNFKENKLPDDQQIKTHLNDISYQNIILDNQKIRFLNEQTMIDLGAIAKGYIADQIKSYLLKN